MVSHKGTPKLKILFPQHTGGGALWGKK
jgi:hypothetical protein